MAVAAASPAGAPGAPGGQVQASGAGAWSIDYGQRFCSLIRQSADRQVPTLTLRQSPGAQYTEMLIVGRDWRPGLLKRIQPVDLILQPSGARRTVDLVPIKADGGLVGFGVEAVSNDFADDLSANDMLVVEARRKPIVAVPIPSARKALKALHDCNDQILTDWGYDVKRQATFRAEALPVGSSPAWFSPKDYPASAIAAGVSDEIVALLSVDAAGTLTGCRVVASANNAALDAQTCRSVMTNGRYNPALDANGRATASKVILRVNWYVAPVVQ